MNIYENIPLSVPNLSFGILDNIKETIETGWVSTGGRFITEFETKFASYVGVENAISTQSGTAGIHLALHVIELEAGEEVIVPTLTFIATVNPVKYMGAEPIFIDCDDTLNMDMDKLEEFLENECICNGTDVFNKRSRRKIKAIIIVHVFGNPANIERLIEIKNKYNLKIIEDAAEALGSKYLKGKYAGKFCGTIGDIGVFSFNANKIITAGGGGMVVSHNKQLIEKAKFLAGQAKTDSSYFIHDEIGYNYRMSNIQAAFGTNQIDKLEDFIKLKIRNYNIYREGIEKIDGLNLLPFRQDTRANHWFYSIIVNKEEYGIDRDTLLKKLNDSNIQTRPLWRLIHKQKPYCNSQSYKLLMAEFYETNLINIPCSSNLTKEEVEVVLHKLREFHLIDTKREII